MGDVLGQVVVAGLAGFRLWRLFARDTIFDRPRMWLAEHAPRQFGWVHCPYCSGFWLSAGCWTVLEWSGWRPAVWFVVVFAAAGVQAVVSVMSERLDD